MACGCNKSKSVTTTATPSKKVDSSAIQRKIAQNLPLVSTRKTTTIPVVKKISKR